ncbi:MAG: DUF1254 domain-containing protein [Xanthobacteraceae bacterium]
MTITRRAVTIGGILFLMPSSSVFAQTSTPLTDKELDAPFVRRRAVDAAVWAIPILNFDAMRQAYFRDGGAKYNDIIWWPKASTWKNQSLTVNTSVRYMYTFSNTREDGPVVIDLPPAVGGASFYGTIENAWFVPLVDIGLEGKGGKYLILPPDYNAEVPPGYISVRPKTYNTGTLVRSILASNSEEDVRKGDELVQQVKIYALNKANNPPTQKFVDMTDIVYDGLIRYDESLYTSLARMVDEEPVQPRDLEMMGMILPLGIEKGKEFKPDNATATQLRGAAGEAKAWLRDKLVSDVTEWWPGSQWKVPAPPIAPATEFHWEVPNYFDVDSRAIALSSFFAPTAKLGSSSFYLGTYHDGSGNRLRGENTYRLRVPANVPVREFWALTAYDLETAALFRNSDRPTLDSLDEKMRKNADGSVDLYIGPKAPAGQDSNWIYTPPAKMWFPWFRLYGPEKAVLDKTWKLPDIEQVS